MVPAPRFDSFDDLNAHLEATCLARQGETLRGHGKTIGERLISDLDALMGLPVAEYEAYDHVSTRATSISMVRYKGNDYSVPVAYRRVAGSFDPSRPHSGNERRKLSAQTQSQEPHIN